MNKNFDLATMNNIENFVRKNKETLNEIDWENISKNKNLTENFIIEFENNIDWFYIKCFQNLSENFLLKFKNKIYWSNVPYSVNLSLSKDFTEKFNTKQP
ncbi:hypothetical protein EXM90_11505 [Clostridium botulinum]|uniref:hypothetical protein n=1 Tax=Clostridium botulinum TaxID=1491 RepID=UPI0007741780|nr:hypothetical protein [Clostridium botulinum]AUN01423.1 hypothetical protein RSJ19_00130 [Clostridium botulinum]MBN3367228.1 hypothetical protein [Clostridium botulinum]MBN3371612.1 hypothetical protein [Clostridium botulinum]MBN3376434.1 hypothetical protein [Clostridium botulinum]MBN3384239.1 hypothetical protein [Clostridium botulinum]